MIRIPLNASFTSVSLCLALLIGPLSGCDQNGKAGTPETTPAAQSAAPSQSQGIASKSKYGQIRGQMSVDDVSRIMGGTGVVVSRGSQAGGGEAVTIVWTQPQTGGVVVVIFKDGKTSSWVSTGLD